MPSRMLMALCALVCSVQVGRAQVPDSIIVGVLNEWQNPPTSAGELGSLVLESADLRDARILTATLGVAANTSKTLDMRVAALRVLLSFAAGNASNVSTPDEITAPDSAILAAAVPGSKARNGSQPITLSAINSLIAPMQTLATSDPNAGIRAAAARVLRNAQRSVAPKPVLSYVCRTKFRIRNSSDFDEFLTYVVSGTDETGNVTVQRRDPNASYKDTFFATDGYGAVILSNFSGEVIGTALNSRASCPP